MPVNHADGQLFLSVPLFPVAAGLGAVHGGAGWLTVAFVPVGLAAGLAIVLLGRPIVYGIMGYGLSCGSKFRRYWIQNVVMIPFGLLYMVLPVAIAWGGLFGVWAGSAWVAEHLTSP